MPAGDWYRGPKHAGADHLVQLMLSVWNVRENKWLYEKRQDNL